ncbi:MAG: SIMPL domain-containing protein [Chloroflexi bacterium]|nr:SIMPL domain-containing protein [Chloroflexota bacterium]
MKKVWMLLGGAATAALMFIGFFAAASLPQHDVQATALAESTCTPQRTLRVTGSASVVATPDVAYITLSVHTEDKKAAAALEENNTLANKVYQTLARYGVEKKDIRTLDISLRQRERYDKNGNLIARYYTVDNTIQVTVHDLDNLGKVLDAVVQSGANRLQGIRFDVSDRAALLEQARLEAVRQAREQASAIAQAAGAELGDVQTISFQTIAPVVDRGDIMMEAAPKAASVPVSGGQMQITATVQMTFALR